MNTKIRKTIVVNRAVPGSGKTTISNCIVDYLKKVGVSVAVHSTDEYFMKGGVYSFDESLLKKFHEQNLESFSHDVKNGTDLVICDNTNLSPWQSEPYIHIARNNSYQVIIINYEPRELEAHVKSQLKSYEKPDAHGVPETVIIEMIKQYYENKKFLDKSYRINYEKDVRLIWDDNALTLKESNIPLMHYDADYVIEIMPDQYHLIKKTIGANILNLMRD